MKANIDKFYLITSKQSCVNLKISDINIENRTCEKLLGVNPIQDAPYQCFPWNFYKCRN